MSRVRALIAPVAAAAALVLAAGAAAAGEFEFTGSVAGEVRGFVLRYHRGEDYGRRRTFCGNRPL